MATITKSTVIVRVGEYLYKAELDGNRVELFRDGETAGTATWSGGSLEEFPKALSLDARDALAAAIVNNLQKAWRAKTETFGEETGPAPGRTVSATAPKTADAANRGQMGNEPGRPSRQGEAEVGVGGSGRDPNANELGGQAIKPSRRAEGDGFSPPKK